MNENVSLSTYEEYCSFEQQYMQPQKVPAGCSFWMIRSKRGVFYDEYIKCGYIAIGWNALLKQDFSTDTEDQKKNKIAIAYPSEQRPTGCVNKCDRFINEMKRGDIAVVVGNGRVSFCIVGDYYEEHIENAVLRELEANAQMEASNYKDYDIPCPYQKRRYIRCIREVAEDNITPILGKAISNRHSLSNLDEYSTAVLSECFDLFEYQGNTYWVFRVTTKDRISAKALSRFFFYTTETLSGETDFNISTKTNLNSPGAIQFCIDTINFAQNHPLAILLLASCVCGGDIDAFGVKISVPSVRSIIKALRDAPHNKQMRDYEEQQAAANIEKTKAETAKLKAEASKLNADVNYQANEEPALSPPTAEQQYINSINSLKIAKPILTKIDFSNVADSQKEDSDDSDESKTPQKTQ